MPFVKLEAGLHKKTIESAISSASAMRSNGHAFRISSRMVGHRAITLSIIGPSVHAGHMALTRMPNLPPSNAIGEFVGQNATANFWENGYGPAVLVMPRTACFAAVYGTWYGLPIKPESEERLTIAPRPTRRSFELRDRPLMTRNSCSFMMAMTAFIQRRIPVTFTSCIAWYSAISTLVIGLALLLPT